MPIKESGSRGLQPAGDHGGLKTLAPRKHESKRPVHRGVVWIAVGAAALYSWFAALTTPFTFRANVMTALPLIAALLAAFLFGHIVRARRTNERSAPRPTGRRLWPWWVSLGVVGAWELFCYLRLPRFDHPTFSSLYDSASRSQPLKAALFLGWLTLGWAIVRAYGRVRR
ncbi:MAG TPA: hypothetical protein VHU17_15475 [Acidimicrobiales bacterium]|jgi:hypothetical protein|nr:hypothetical protein [Acidimicrobiales bacterium]